MVELLFGTEGMYVGTGKLQGPNILPKKEARESEFWLELSEPFGEFEKEKGELLQEVLELRKILGAILEKSK